MAVVPRLRSAVPCLNPMAVVRHTLEGTISTVTWREHDGQAEGPSIPACPRCEVRM